MVEELKSRGIAVIYITHRIDQIFGHCNRIVILEDGKQLGDFFREKTSIRELEDIIRRGEVSNGFTQQGGVGAQTQRA
jgi:ribose transport system ATP-binding protein